MPRRSHSWPGRASSIPAPRSSADRLRAATKTQCLKISDAAVQAEKDITAATTNQVKAIETKIQDLFKICDGRIQKAEDDLKGKLKDGEDKLTTALKGSEDKIKKLKDDGDAKIAKLETDSLKKLQTDYDNAVKAIDKRVEAARKTLAASNGKNLKALEQMVDQTCKAIDKQVADTEKKFDHTVQDADKQASAFILQQLQKIRGEAQHALDAIDKNYQEALKMVDDAVESAHRSMEDASKGKMLEIEVHIGTMMKDCGDSSRYDASYKQLEYYIKNKLPIPSGYGEAAPAEPSKDAKKEDEKKDGANPAPAADKKDATAEKPGEPKKDPEPPGAEVLKLQKEEADHAALLKSNDFKRSARSQGSRRRADEEGPDADGRSCVGEGAAFDQEGDRGGDRRDDEDARSRAQADGGRQERRSKAMESVNAQIIPRTRASGMRKKPRLRWTRRASSAGKSRQEGRAQVHGRHERGRGPGVQGRDAQAGHQHRYVDRQRDERGGEDRSQSSSHRQSDRGRHRRARSRQGSPHDRQREARRQYRHGILLAPLGPLALLGAGSVVNSDQNIGSDKERIAEILAKYKGNPIKLAAFKAEYEKTGNSLAGLLHETGNDALAGQMNPEHVDLHKKPEDIKNEGTNQVEALQKKNPEFANNHTKMDSAAEAAQRALHDNILDSSKNNAIKEALKDLTPEEAEYVKAKYKANTGHDLELDMDKELSGVGKSTAKASLRADKDTLALNKVLGAEEAGWTNYTLDDDKMKNALKELEDPEERRKVLAAYEAKTGRKLTDVLEKKMSGNDRDIAVAWAKGETAKALAAEADEKLNGGWMNGMHRAIHDRTKQAGLDVDTEAFTRPMVNFMVNPVAATEAMVTGEDQKKVNCRAGTRWSLVRSTRSTPTDCSRSSAVMPQPGRSCRVQGGTLTPHAPQSRRRHKEEDVGHHRGPSGPELGIEASRRRWMHTRRSMTGAWTTTTPRRWMTPSTA